MYIHRFGTRFPAITSAYDQELRKLAADTGKELGMEKFMQTGIYFSMSGPAYETPAESRMMRSLGGDCLGMSTIPEIVVAKHCGMKVLGMTSISQDSQYSESQDHSFLHLILKFHYTIFTYIIPLLYKENEQTNVYLNLFS